MPTDFYEISVATSRLIHAIADDEVDDAKVREAIVDGAAVVDAISEQFRDVKRLWKEAAEEALAVIGCGVQISPYVELTITPDRRVMCDDPGNYLRQVYQRSGIEGVIHHIRKDGVKPSEAQKGFPGLYATYFSDHGTGCLKLTRKRIGGAK